MKRDNGDSRWVEGEALALRAVWAPGRHSRHVGEERAQGLQRVIPEILEFPAQLLPHLRVDFGNGERIRLISQEVAVVSGLEMNFQV